MNKIPFRVTLLIWLVLFLTAWNALQLWTALAWREVLDKYSPESISSILAISSAIGLLTGIIIFWGIWREKNWTAKLLLGSTAGYTVWYWIERLAWQNPHPNWLFAVIVNLAIIIFILFTIKSLAREAYERKIENPKTE